MRDTIYRDDAIRVASGYCHPANIAKELAKLPSAEPERCRTCKWVTYHGDVDKHGNVESAWYCKNWEGYTDEEGFCHEWEARPEVEHES